MIKTVTMVADGRVFDFDVFRNGELFLDITIYEVKHPERKYFRHGNTPFYDAWMLIDRYDTIEDCLLATLTQGLDAEKTSKKREAKVQNFFKKT